MVLVGAVAYMLGLVMFVVLGAMALFGVYHLRVVRPPLERS